MRSPSDDGWQRRGRYRFASFSSVSTEGRIFCTMTSTPIGVRVRAIGIGLVVLRVARDAGCSGDKLGTSSHFRKRCDSLKLTRFKLASLKLAGGANKKAQERNMSS